MKSIAERIRPENVITIIIINNDKENDRISLFDSLFDICRFTRLRSLTIHQIKDINLEHFLNCLSTNSLTSLSIESNEQEHSSTWNLVSSAMVRWNLWKLCISTANYMIEHILWPDQYKLGHLEFSDCIYSEYLLILHCLPNLQTLIIRNCIMNENQVSPISSTSMLHASLKSLTITDCSLIPQHLELLLSSTPSLYHLKLVSHRKSFDSMFQSCYWEQLIRTKLLELDQFEFFFASTNFKNNKFISLETFVSPFRAPFWLEDKHCFVSCAYVPSSRAIWLHTTPIKGINYQELIRCETFTTLNIARKLIGSAGAQHLANALKNNTTLTTLDLSTNQMQNTGIQYLTDVLENNTTITSVNLATNRIGPAAAQHLAKVLRTNTILTTLDLHENPIRDLGIEYFADALSCNTTLTTLNLCQAQIGNKGVGYLSKALSSNTTLTTLNLAVNQIGDVGAQHLFNALQKNKTLQKLILRYGNSISSLLFDELEKTDNRLA
ncbi:unnamed protein product [Adineta steineri]|uniref:Uncharacterized protein n=1 Tax=Adineta steineri TaxID=433720 RepID=A0A818UIJ4_9BILA|nr:unnamed protein product [Adineta steineri]